MVNLKVVMKKSQKQMSSKMKMMVKNKLRPKDNREKLKRQKLELLKMKRMKSDEERKRRRSR
jgi:hypothetical protein